MLYSKFEDLNLFFKKNKILILTHDFVDIDALASCFVLRFFINQLYHLANVDLFFHEISKGAINFINIIAEKFPNANFSLRSEIKSFEYDIIFILDTNNLKQVKFSDNFDILKLGIPFIFIDHHLNHKKDYGSDINPMNIIDDNFSSTAEIIYELCEYSKIKILLPYKFILIAAILIDSGFLKYGNNDTIMRISKLLNHQIDFQQLLLTLNTDEEIPEKLARIKALQRVKIIQEGSWLIGITNVGSFESSSASTLLKVGFDIGIVSSKKKLEIRISTRAKKSICLKTGLHLGKILEELSEELGGNGGGHDGAASITSNVDSSLIIDKLLEKIKQVLNK